MRADYLRQLAEWQAEAIAGLLMSARRRGRVICSEQIPGRTTHTRNRIFEIFESLKHGLMRCNQVDQTTMQHIDCFVEFISRDKRSRAIVLMPIITHPCSPSALCLKYLRYARERLRLPTH